MSLDESLIILQLHELVTDWAWKTFQSLPDLKQSIQLPLVDVIPKGFWVAPVWVASSELFANDHRATSPAVC